jgi:hypothetical protein
VSQEIGDRMCKTAVNRFSKSIRRVTSKRALDRCGKKLVNTEATPQAIWPIAKSLNTRDEPRAPTAIHGLLILKCNSLEEAKAIENCSENQFKPHAQCDENH